MEGGSTITKNVYCPVCAQRGKNKLLFKKRPEAQGKILIMCRGCREEVEIELDDKEPMSRK
jgi:hypothetical protein